MRRAARRPLRATTIGLCALAALAALGLGAGACRADEPTRDAPAPGAGGDDGRFPRVPASQAFWAAWSHGEAEVATYRVTEPRYGQPRDGVAVLIHVLEEHDRRTWIKDDRGAVPDEHKAVVMKLNHTLQFQTGVYPYSVMTSVFAPVGGIGRERFAPTRIVFTAQEWCGQVFQRLLPDATGFAEELRSYFSAEGEVDRRTETAPYALYEDALFIQLREPDGAFAGGGDWEGEVVPSLWRRRKAHEPLTARPAAITRSEAVAEDGTPVTRFVLRFRAAPEGALPIAPERAVTFDVEKAAPRRILGWSTTEGERATLVGFARLPYWQLNKEGDEAVRARIGLRPTVPLLTE